MTVLVIGQILCACIGWQFRYVASNCGDPAFASICCFMAAHSRMQEESELEDLTITIPIISHDKTTLEVMPLPSVSDARSILDFSRLLVLGYFGLLDPSDQERLAQRIATAAGSVFHRRGTRSAVYYLRECAGMLDQLTAPLRLTSFSDSALAGPPWSMLPEEEVQIQRDLLNKAREDSVRAAIEGIGPLFHTVEKRALLSDEEWNRMREQVFSATNGVYGAVSELYRDDPDALALLEKDRTEVLKFYCGSEDGFHTLLLSGSLPLDQFEMVIGDLREHAQSTFINDTPLTIVDRLLERTFDRMQDLSSEGFRQTYISKIHEIQTRAVTYIHEEAENASRMARAHNIKPSSVHAEQVEKFSKRVEDLADARQDVPQDPPANEAESQTELGESDPGRVTDMTRIAVAGSIVLAVIVLFAFAIRRR